MPTNKIVDLAVVKHVADALGELKDEVLFVGGSIASLYANDPVASEPRPTKDVDVSVQVASYTEMNKLSESLAHKGFSPAADAAILYRYKLDDIIVDFIPFEPTSLGPTNSWLKPGFDVSVNYDLEGTNIRILPVAYFLASKWEAFLARGKKDPISSHDLEDFIYVIDYHLELVDHVLSSDDKVKDYLKEACEYIMALPGRDTFIEAQLIPSIAADRRKMIISKLKKIIA